MKCFTNGGIGEWQMAKNRVCLFCGNSNLSKEHIFAQWLLK